MRKREFEKLEEAMMDKEAKTEPYREIKLVVYGGLRCHKIISDIRRMKGVVTMTLLPSAYQWVPREKKKKK